MASTLAGLVGGLLGAVVTAAAATVATEDPLPATVVWAKYLGDGVADGYERRGTVVHLLYGGVAGVLFVAVAGLLGLGVSTLSGALLWGVLWSVLLLSVAVGFWLAVLVGEVPDARGAAELAVGHLGYGLVLGITVFTLAGL